MQILNHIQRAPIRQRRQKGRTNRMMEEDSQQQKVDTQQYPAELFRQRTKSIMRWWTFLGPTTNRSLLLIAGLLAHSEGILLDGSYSPESQFGVDVQLFF